MPADLVSAGVFPEHSRLTTFWDDYPVLRTDLERVQSVILDAMTARSSYLTEALVDLASRGGKMLRPGFALLAARMKETRTRHLLVKRQSPPSFFAVLPDKIYRMAAAIEILHLASLVHDDVIDDADYRRSQPTLHQKYGRREAILMGDYLFSKCFSLVADYGSMENAQLLASGVSHICAGEISQAEQSDPDHVSVRGYIHRVIGKTALLFTLSFHVGASENGIENPALRALRRIGHNVGIGFQIIDDILDFTGSTGQLGKSAGNDLRNGILTLPVIHALAHDDGELASYIKSGACARADIDSILSRIESRGGLWHARRDAERYTARALREAATLPDCDVKEALLGVIRRLLVRQY